MYQRVSTEEFFKVIGPLNVTLEIRGNYPYKTLFRLKQGGKLVGFEEHERYYLNVEDTRTNIGNFSRSINRKSTYSQSAMRLESSNFGR